MRYIIALLVFLSYVQSSWALCSWKDAECLAPKVLPGYTKDADPKNPSTREWSASNGVTFGYGNRIITRVRFDQEAVDILRSNSDFGREIESVLKGPNRNITGISSLIGLKRLFHSMTVLLQTNIWKVKTQCCNGTTIDSDCLF